ncbi:hypothetical protein A0257_14885 [Hymenobacter psoromatis]|nr:hypothetical protein A0257_14885 [Hymenobacter psoromatis]
MFTSDNFPLLAAELAEVDRMMEELSPGAITSKRTLQNRKKVLESRLTLLAEQPETAVFVELLFTGAPVLDSRAIDVSFAAEALQRYQDIIAKATAVAKGGLGSRGVIAGTATESSRFFLTGVARGSFGFTLEENTGKGTTFFDSTLKEVVADVSSKMSNFCDTTDEEYDTFIREIDKRLFASFKGFFKLLHEAAAQLKIVGRHDSRKFDAHSLEKAFVRTETTQVEEDERRITGVLLGLTPLDGTFNFLSTNQTAFSGKLAPTFSLEYRNQVDKGEFLQAGTRYSAHIVRRTTKRGGAAPHVAYFLISLLEADNPDNPDTLAWH